MCRGLSPDSQKRPTRPLRQSLRAQAPARLRREVGSAPDLESGLRSEPSGNLVTSESCNALRRAWFAIMSEHPMPFFPVLLVDVQGTFRLLTDEQYGADLYLVTTPKSPCVHEWSSSRLVGKPEAIWLPRQD